MSEERLIELETRLAYQDDALTVLNEVVTRQDRRIQQLEETCRLLIERLRNNGDPVFVGTPADEVPPHY